MDNYLIRITISLSECRLLIMNSNSVYPYDLPNANRILLAARNNMVEVKFFG